MKDATRLITGLGAIAVVAVIALGWFLGVSPLLAQAAQSDAERATVEEQNNSLRAQLAVLKQQFENMDEYQDRLELLGALIPDDDPLEEFYVAVNDCGVQAGAIGLDSITTGDAVPYADTSVSDGIIVAPGASLKPNLFSIPVHVEVGASPEASVAFVRCLQEDWTRVIAINKFRIAAGSKPGIVIDGYLFRVTDPSSIAARLAAPYDDGKDEADGEDSEETPATDETPSPEPSETSAPAGEDTPTP